MRGSFMQILQLALSSIQVPAYRQRKEIEGEGLSELMASIEANGLLQPIVVRTETVSSGFAGNSQQAYSLVAGHRRLSAIFLLAGMAQKYKFGDRLWSPEFIPCVNLGDLDQLAAEEAELEENVRRIDLTWDERARATARLSGLRSRRAQQGNRPQPSVGEIALEVRGSAEATARETTRREIILAPFLEVQAPHLKGTKSLDEAWKAHLREEERLKNIDTPEEWERLIGILGAHWYRVAKEQAHLYVCCDIDGFHFARKWLTSVGWRVHRTPIVNFKRDGSRVPWPQHGPQRKWELVLYAVKGNRPVTRIYPDVIETHGDDNLGHGAQKPVELYTNLLTRSVRPGDSALDCFGGTGTIIPACHALKCKATYIEQDSNCYGLAVKRLKELL